MIWLQLLLNYLPGAGVDSCKFMILYIHNLYSLMTPPVATIPGGVEGLVPPPPSKKVFHHILKDVRII